MAIFGKKDNKDNKNNEKETPAVPAAAPAKEPAPAATPAPAAAPAPEAQAAPAAPKYQTPEGFDFNRYFLAERRVMLENINYETLRITNVQGQFKLGVKDTIVAQVMGQAGVKVTFNRALRFEPEGPFSLSVSFGVMLVFNPGTRDEIDWKTIDVAEEFKKNCPQLIQQMAAKATLLVAEITNANGNPIIPVR